MADEHIISVRMVADDNASPVERVSGGQAAQPLAVEGAGTSTHTFVKAAAGALVFQSFSRELSVHGQLTGDYVTQNKIDVARNAAQSLLALGVAMYVNPILGGIALAGQLIAIGQENRNIQIQAAKSELYANNLREYVGLEATNFSRYKGRRR